jgi:hypothetical protein
MRTHIIRMSGKVVTSAKARDEICDAFEAMYPVLEGFRTSDAVPQPGPGGGSVVAPAAALPKPGAGGDRPAPWRPCWWPAEKMCSSFDVDV